MHNVEKSAFQKGQYVGYGGGAVWHIRSYGKGNWKATPQGNNKHSVFSCATLRDVSTQLETLSAKPMDAALTSARKANPAPRKRAISRPSQVTKKAPTKRLVSRRKAAAKKPVKGYFPNPRKAEKLVTLQIEIDRGKGWEFYTNFQHGKSHVRAITEMATDAAKHAAKMNPSWMVRVIKK